MRPILAWTVVFSLPALGSPGLVSTGATGTLAGTGSLRQIQGMHVVRASHTATALLDGRVLIAGGFPGSGAEQRPYASTELFDPKAGRFLAAGPMTVGRSGHTATLLRSGKVLVAGGWTGSGGSSGSADLYDPSTGRFVPTGGMVVGRAGSTATLLPDGRVLVSGGVDAPCCWETAGSSSPAAPPSPRSSIPRRGGSSGRAGPWGQRGSSRPPLLSRTARFSCRVATPRRMVACRRATQPTSTLADGRPAVPSNPLDATLRNFFRSFGLSHIDDSGTAP